MPNTVLSTRTTSYDRIFVIDVSSTEELERYLNDDEGTVLVDQYVTQMDVVRVAY